MGFLDSLGSAVGKMAAQAQEIQAFKGDYESMSDYDLKREYNELLRKGSWRSTEENRRFSAVKLVLTDRGIAIPHKDV